MNRGWSNYSAPADRFTCARAHTHAPAARKAAWPAPLATHFSEGGLLLARPLRPRGLVRRRRRRRRRRVLPLLDLRRRRGRRGRRRLGLAIDGRRRRRGLRL